MTVSVRGPVLGVMAILLGGFSLRADFIPISQPTAPYLKSTTLLDFTDPDHTQVGFVFGGGETLFFDNLLEERTVPASWPTWGTPPATETATPRIGYTSGASELTIALGAPAKTFGFELEPDNQAPEQVVAAFYSGQTLVGTISLTPDGDAGALLYAASTSTNPFTSVVITDLAPATSAGPSDFAIARQRFTLATPEPASWGLMGSAFVVAGLLWRRKWQRTSIRFGGTL